MQLLERTQECEPKYDIWPYKKRNTGGSITKIYRCVDLTMMHICTKFERNPSRNVACRAHTRFPPKYDLWPYKRRNTGGSITKNNRRVDFTKIHLHTKFERNPSRNAAVRAHTRMWRGGVTLLNPKYPPAVPAGDTIITFKIHYKHTNITHIAMFQSHKSAFWGNVFILKHSENNVYKKGQS